MKKELSGEEKHTMEGNHSKEENHSREENHSMEKRLSMEKRHSRRKRSREERYSVEESRSREEKYLMESLLTDEKANCKEFERLIPGFIARELDYPTLNGFYEHWEKCDECKEELSIQFLVREGMQRLEKGEAFDLQSELDQRLEEARRKINSHSAFLYLGLTMEIMASCLLVWVFVWILL